MSAITQFYGQHQAALHVVGALLAAVLAWVVVRRVLVRAMTYTAKRTKATWDDVLVEQGVFGHLPYLAPAAVLYLAAPAFPEWLVEPIRRVAMAYFAVNGIILIDKFLNTTLVIYRKYPISKERPIKGYVQVIKILVYLIGGIVAVSLLLDQSPWAFLGGIGALTAVLLLVFRDTILSFVAGIQIASNDMVRVGDWIEVPKYGADGDVIEMALNTVKVQNWDKTVTAIPTYKLVEDSFKNWRGMTESGGRRIARSLSLDLATVRFLDEATIERLKRIEILKPYLESKQAELAEHNNAGRHDTSELLNGRRLTNIGTFRAYVVAYLKSHPRLRQDMTLLVRLLSPAADGVPLQIYAFTDTTAWLEYEAIQSDIFDHLLAAADRFGLRVFQNPSGADIGALGGALGQELRGGGEPPLASSRPS